MPIDTQNKSRLYARVAACNFNNTIFDTNDISTIRGSSLILLRFPAILIDNLQKTYPTLQAKEITSGASELLFSFDTAPGNYSLVEDYLRKTLTDSTSPLGLPLYLFTFVWSVEKTVPQSDFKHRLKTLAAWCNFEQFQHPTVRISAPIPNMPLSPDQIVCPFDRISPTTPSKKQKGKPVSLSVYERREAGLDAKKTFYKNELHEDLLSNSELAQDFSHLVTSPDRRLGIPESLKGKMALIYLDGNFFGSERERIGTNPLSLRKFSEHIKERRKTLLKDVLTSLIKELGMCLQDKETVRLRFETLLWGGDEIMWVLPAWQAWSLMETIQKNLNHRDWNNLTHATGLLIAPYKAPIKELTTLVKSLGDAAKLGNGRSINGIQIGVVAGFDLPGLTTDDLRQPLLFPRGGGNDVPHGPFQMNGAEWDRIKESMERIKEPKGGLPLASLHRIYHDALAQCLFSSEKAEAARVHLEQGIDRIKIVHGNIDEDACDILRNGFPGATDISKYPLIPLYQILQLWDIAR